LEKGKINKSLCIFILHTSANDIHLCLPFFSELIEEYGNGKGKATKKGREKEKASQQVPTSKSSMYVMYVWIAGLFEN
jgi:hypothetical protein